MRIHVLVLPGSKKESIEELIDLEGNIVYKIKLRAKPIQGEANAALLEFLHMHFNIPKKNIVIVSGNTSRHKLIEIQGTENKERK